MFLGNENALARQNHKQIDKNMSYYIVSGIFHLLFAELISLEDVIKELAADTLDNGTSVGLFGNTFSPGNFSEVAILELKVGLVFYPFSCMS